MTVLVTGGEVRPAKKSLTGDFALASINQIRAAKCILGCSGISAERGLTTLVSNEMRVNSLMLKHSEQHIVLADASKLGVNSSFQYGLPADIDVLMTDESASISQVAALEAAGVRKVVRVGLLELLQLRALDDEIQLSIECFHCCSPSVLSSNK